MQSRAFPNGNFNPNLWMNLTCCLKKHWQKKTRRKKPKQNPKPLDNKWRRNRISYRIFCYVLYQFGFWYIHALSHAISFLSRHIIFLVLEEHAIIYNIYILFVISFTDLVVCCFRLILLFSLLLLGFFLFFFFEC